MASKRSVLDGCRTVGDPALLADAALGSNALGRS